MIAEGFMLLANGSTFEPFARYNTTMKINEAYNLWSESYDAMQNRTRDLDTKITEDWLRGKHFETILEIGCGTGKNTTTYAAYADRVVSADFSEGMLQLARQKIDAKNVTFVQADITTDWTFTDLKANLITCNLVLEHIQDLSHICRQVYDKLQPGGLFFLSELHPFKQCIGGQANFEYSNETIMVAAYVHHISEYFSAATEAGLHCIELFEHYVDEAEPTVPRIINMVFEKQV